MKPSSRIETAKPRTDAEGAISWSEIRWIKTKDLQADPVANELANSEAMQPYMDYHVAALGNVSVDGGVAS
jgi:hypothetical protein